MRARVKAILKCIRPNISYSCQKTVIFLSCIEIDKSDKIFYLLFMFDVSRCLISISKQTSSPFKIFQQLQSCQNCFFIDWKVGFQILFDWNIKNLICHKSYQIENCFYFNLYTPVLLNFWHYSCAREGEDNFMFISRFYKHRTNIAM